MFIDLARKSTFLPISLRRLTVLPILLLGLLVYLTACSESKFRPSPERIDPNIACGAQPVPVEITGNNFMAIISEDLSKKEKPEVDKLFRVILRHTESKEERSLGNIVFYHSKRFTAVVPGGLRSRWHDLIVTNPDGETGTLPEAFYVTSICSVGPTTGCPGDSVTISGTDFGTNTGTVTFNGTSATVTSWGNTSISVIAPGGDYTEVTVTPTPAAEPVSLPGTYSYDNQAPTGLAASPAGGSYCATAVSLTVSEGTVYYTTDGSGPTTVSPVYAVPINISVDTTLNFMAVDVCGNQAATVTEVYDIDAEGPTSLVASPAGGSYCATAVSLSASDGTIYYTTDGSGPTTGSSVYTGPIVISVDTTLNFMAVDACGNQAATVNEVYDIDAEGPTSLVASPAGGSYCPTTVSLSASDGTIYYTLDGSVPTTGSPVYTGIPINISGDTTLNFMVVDVCGNQAVTVTEVYGIDTEAVVTITSPTDGVTILVGDVTVSGTANIDITTVTVTSDQGLPGEPYSSPVDLGGNWSVTLIGVNEPQITIYARGTDGCGNIGSDSVINGIIVPAQLTITKLVENLTRLLGPSSTVGAFSGDQVNYIVTIKNEGKEDATLGDGDFDDLMPVGLTCDGPMTVIGAVAGALHCDVPSGDIVIDVPIVISGPSTVVFIYRATVD